MKRTMRRPGKATTVSRRARVSGPVFKARDVAALAARMQRMIGEAGAVNESLRTALWEMEDHDTHRREERARNKQEATDRAAVERAIKASGGNLRRAAAMLDCSLGELYSKIHAAGIQLELGGSRGKAGSVANTVQVATWIPRELRAAIKARAASEGSTVSAFVRKVLAASLEGPRSSTADPLLTPARVSPSTNRP